MFTGSTGGGIRCEIVGVVGDVRSVSLRAGQRRRGLPAADRSVAQPFGQLVAARRRRSAADARATCAGRSAPSIPSCRSISRQALSAVADASLGQRKLTDGAAGSVRGARARRSRRSASTALSPIWSASGPTRSGSASRSGAATRDVLRLVTWQGLRPVVAGLAIGLARRRRGRPPARGACCTASPRPIPRRSSLATITLGVDRARRVCDPGAEGIADRSRNRAPRATSTEHRALSTVLYLVSDHTKASAAPAPAACSQSSTRSCRNSKPDAEEERRRDQSSRQ